ncbi:pilZ domain protein, partial [Vibrio harveyi]
MLCLADIIRITTYFNRNNAA